MGTPRKEERMKRHPGGQIRVSPRGGGSCIFMESDNYVNDASKRWQIFHWCPRRASFNQETQCECAVSCLVNTANQHCFFPINSLGGQKKPTPKR